MQGFTSGILSGDEESKYYLASCTAYTLRDDKPAFELSKMWHKLDENCYIDDYEIQYFNINFTDGMKFNCEHVEDKTPFAYKCRLYKIKE